MPSGGQFISSDVKRAAQKNNHWSRLEDARSKILFFAGLMPGYIPSWTEGWRQIVIIVLILF